jgi:ribonuclease HI
VKGWNERFPSWRANGWKKRKGGAPDNLAYFQRLQDAVERHSSVHFEWTRSHIGTEANERAHKLAYLARSFAIQRPEHAWTAASLLGPLDQPFPPAPFVSP